MTKSTTALLGLTLIICTPAWYSVSFQVKYIPPELAVGLRFFIAGLVLEVYRRFRGEAQDKLSSSTLSMILFQGLFLFSVNYWLCYESNQYMVTGLIAATVSTMIIPNMVFGKIFLDRPIRLQASLGALLGLVGVFCLFQNDIIHISEGYGSLPGLALAFSSTFLSVIGTILTGKVLARGVSVAYATSRALLVGGLFSLLWSLSKYGFVSIPSETDFIISLLYLSVVATTLGGLLYSRLIKEIGPGLASYLWIAMPTVSLAMSAVFEDYDWTIYSSLGLIFVTIGGVFAISGEAFLAYLRQIFPTVLGSRQS